MKNCQRILGLLVMMIIFFGFWGSGVFGATLNDDATVSLKLFAPMILMDITHISSIRPLVMPSLKPLLIGKNQILQWMPEIFFTDSLLPPLKKVGALPS